MTSSDKLLPKAGHEADRLTGKEVTHSLCLIFLSYSLCLSLFPVFSFPSLLPSSQSCK